MWRRILNSVLTVVVLTTAVLGLPLMYTAWLQVEQNVRHDLKERLDRVASELTVQEHGGVVTGPLHTTAIVPLIPDRGRLVVVYPTPYNRVAHVDLGAPTVAHPITESLAMGPQGSLRLEVDNHSMRRMQERAVAAVALVVVASLAAGTAVAVLTAHRLSDPLRVLAERAAQLSRGDFRPGAYRHGIPELDRVADALEDAAREIRSRLKSEHALVADVSHQLRSRLTAVRLRLDELSAHSDAAVVTEAEEAMAQVDRLTNTINDLIRASRADAASSRTLVAPADELADVVNGWQAPYADARRELRIAADPGLRITVTAPRLREAVAVLIDNALVHGAGTCTVDVRAVDTAAPGHSSETEPIVRIDVSDEGPGVSDELAPHIFERGFSGAGSTGMGLALARALIEADGGRLVLQRRRPPMFTIFLGMQTAATPVPAEPR